MKYFVVFVMVFALILPVQVFGISDQNEQPELSFSSNNGEMNS